MRALLSDWSWKGWGKTLLAIFVLWMGFSSLDRLRQLLFELCADPEKASLCRSVNYNDSLAWLGLNVIGTVLLIAVVAYDRR